MLGDMKEVMAVPPDQAVQHEPRQLVGQGQLQVRVLGPTECSWSSILLSIVIENMRYYHLHYDLVSPSYTQTVESG